MGKVVSKGETHNDQEEDSSSGFHFLEVHAPSTSTGGGLSILSVALLIAIVGLLYIAYRRCVPRRQLAQAAPAAAPAAVAPATNPIPFSMPFTFPWQTTTPPGYPYSPHRIHEISDDDDDDIVARRPHRVHHPRREDPAPVSEIELQELRPSNPQVAALTAALSRLEAGTTAFPIVATRSPFRIPSRSPMVDLSI